MYLPKEFTPLITPQYKTASLEDWSLFQCNAQNHPRKVLAYYRNNVDLPRNYWVLTQNETVWMSLTPMELESQGYHGRMATGHVVVAGLGMGALVHHLLNYNSKVTKVTVVETNPKVVEILALATDWFVPGKRLEVVIGDARQFVPNQTIDTLIVDIWPGLGQPNAASDVQAIQNNVRAKIVGWWGQELSLVSFWHDSGGCLPLTHEILRNHEKSVGFPILGYKHPLYKKLAFVAALNVATVMRQQQIA